LSRADGDNLWTCQASGCGAVTYADGLLWFVDSQDQGGLIAINSNTGQKAWELPGLRSCNAFVKVGRVGYLKTLDGVVHAIFFKG
jgi:outer membrane protein assembly factor BamB